MSGPLSDADWTPRDPAAEVCTALRGFFRELARSGVRDVCLCPGSRSTPLVLAAHAAGSLRLHPHVDERSAAFFALGMARASQRPVALICTSGTAAVNFAPAVVEAFHSHVPVLVLTADRPVEVRGWGAPQAIDQVRLYGGFVRWFAEVPVDVSRQGFFAALARRAVGSACGWPAGPVHINFPLREPLVPRNWPLVRVEETPAPHGPRRHAPGAEPEAPSVAALPEQDARRYTTAPAVDPPVVEAAARWVRSAGRGVIACGPVFGDEVFAGAVARLAACTGFPVIADPLSGLRDGRHERDRIIVAGDALLRHPALAEELRPDLVVRIGPVPVSRAFSEWVSRHEEADLLVVDGGGDWPDPQHRAAAVFQADPTRFCADLAAAVERAGPPVAEAAWTGAWLKADRAATSALRGWVSSLDEPFEGVLFAALEEVLPDGAVLCVGNSMPVRDLDTYWPGRPRPIRLLANRGVNGIDGFLSTVLGAAATAPGRVAGVSGDLAFLHDAGGLLAARRHGLRALLVVIENDGGGIFSFLPQVTLPGLFESYFATPHGLDIGPVVEAYGGRFERAARRAELEASLRRGQAHDGLFVVGVPVNRSRSAQLHREGWAVAGNAGRVALERGKPL